MKRVICSLALCTTAVLIPGSLPARAATPLTTVRLASGLSNPLFITHAPGDGDRMFIVERTGRIKIMMLSNNQVLTTPFLNVSGQIATNWLEYGLLGLAFHPDFQNNGFFYVNYTPPNGTIADTIVVRYRVSDADANVADTATATTILRFSFGTRREHRAGWMEFGPDGYLYITTGDGGENDPDNAAQNLTLLRGKLLRIDVNGPDGIPGTPDDDEFPSDANRNYTIPIDNPFRNSPPAAPEIWAYGLRNAWRAGFDRQTGDLWIGDVGQGTREEIDFQAAGLAGGRNYGWRCTEGTFCTGFSGCTCNGPTLTRPIYEYVHSIGVSVTGGYVYRGCAIPDLRGTYFYGDYQVSKIFSLRYDGVMISEAQERTAELAPGGGLTVSNPASFGEDLLGELYICDYGGEIYKIVPRAFVGPDCNGNSVNDDCDIAGGHSHDGNGNGVPDECDHIAGDMNCDGVVDNSDIDGFALALVDPGGYSAAYPGCPITNADTNGDEVVDNSDIDSFVALLLG